MAVQKLMVISCLKQFTYRIIECVIDVFVFVNHFNKKKTYNLFFVINICSNRDSSAREGYRLLCAVLSVKLQRAHF